MIESDQELLQLISLVKQYRKPCNTVDWSAVQAHFPHLSKIELQNKFYGYLRKHKEENPELIHNHKWTDYEKSYLQSLVQQHGKNWHIIHNYFPSLSLIQLKNKYQQLRSKNDPEKEISELCTELAVQLAYAEKMLNEQQ